MSSNSGSVDLSDKVALITGASRGIGATVAKAYAAAGAHVVLMARTVGGLEAIDDEIRAAGGQATLIPQDLLQLDELDALGPALAEKFGRLDIFVGNAGMLGTLSPIGHADVKEWQRVMDINFTANVRLIRTLDPLLKGAAQGRAVFVTTGMVKWAQAYWGAYSASKAAVQTLARTYAAENEKSNLRINLISPGAVETKMLDTAFPGGYQGKRKKPEDLVPAFLELASDDCKRHGEIIDLND